MGKQKLTVENIQERCSKLYDIEYDYSQCEYINNSTKIKLICPKHGEFFVQPKHLLNGHGCPKCGYEKIKLKLASNTFDFIKKSTKIHGDKYDYSKVEYVNNSTKVCIICPVHGEFWQKPDKHLSGHGCLECGKNKCTQNRVTTIEEFIRKANKIHCKQYIYSNVEYKNCKEKVCIICPIHGEFWQTPDAHLQGYGCPKCNQSHLESKIGIFLKDNNIEFEEQKKFDWLGKQSLDFYLPQYNVAIECQGIQHFKSIDYFGGEEEYQKILERDERKRKLCEENCIKLLYYSNLKITFPYQVFNNIDFLIEEIFK